MFAIHCARHGAEVLLGPSNVLGLHRTDAGIAVAYRCHCGHRGVWLTGRDRRRGASAPDAAAA